MSNNILNPFITFGGANDWIETFDFNDSYASVTSGNTGTFDGVGGTIDVDDDIANQLSFANVDQPCSSYSSKLFAEGALSDTMFTMLADATVWTKVQQPPAPCFFGASNANVNLKDSNDCNFLGGILAGCGPTDYGNHSATKDGTNAVAYSACWTGNGSGSDNWDTLYRTSATGARYFSYPTSDRTGTPSYDETYTISSGTTDLDRFFACGQNDGPTGRDSDGKIDQIIFKNEVNEE